MIKAGVVAVIAGLLAGCASVHSDNTMDVDMHRVSASGVGPSVGHITIRQVPKGVEFTPDLHGLPPGLHGFHLHEFPSCQPGPDASGQMAAAMTAGGHYDPGKTGHHEGPYGHGHLGDLPRLAVDKSGNATTSVIAPRLSLHDLSGHSLMIHAGGDNYSDNPPMGGGGQRIVCGVINK